MRIVVALGGNALLRRGEHPSVESQRENVRRAAAQLAEIASGNSLVIVHGNGPQVGLLASQGMSMPEDERFPLDVLDAETEGLIGYLLELEVRNSLLGQRVCTSMLTMVEVNPDDPAFARPDKPIGAMYSQADANTATRERGWTMALDGPAYRRVVASPKPVGMLQVQPVRWLLAHGSIVICAGGGGIPVVAGASGSYRGVEAVIDKDRSAALLAREIEADLFVIATDVRGLYLDWGALSQRPVRRASPEALGKLAFAAGSMGPKVEAACEFTLRTRNRAVIGSLDDIGKMVAGTAGTSIVLGQAQLEEGPRDIGVGSNETPEPIS
jgi:carbamate kinase